MLTHTITIPTIARPARDNVQTAPITRPQIHSWVYAQSLSPRRAPCTEPAPVAGVNDQAGTSCIDVQKRLNVNANGCSLPASYGQPSVTLNAPNNFRIT